MYFYNQQICLLNSKLFKIIVFSHEIFGIEAPKKMVNIFIHFNFLNNTEMLNVYYLPGLK